MQKYKLSIFIFRRDLRIDDNSGFIAAMKQSQNVLPCFIFNPQQIENNPYKSDNALQFMLESLEDLQQQFVAAGGKLYLFYNQPQIVLSNLLEKTKAQAVFCNRDYTPFSNKRDGLLHGVCRKRSIDFYRCPDYLLTEPEQVKNLQGQPYKVFTPFFKKARFLSITRPQKTKTNNFFSTSLKEQVSLKQIKQKILPTINKNLYCKGGRTDALQRLQRLSRHHNYKQARDYPIENGTTGLSAHNKFGTISIRELFYAIAEELGEEHTLITELYWRDFFTHIAHHNPQVFGRCFYEKYEKLKWKNDKQQYLKWCNGNTGFPIVDAGMRELNSTGYMHNRVRMIVASFLVKDLHIDWRWGEKYFAQKLLDYDPCVNNGNWQWAASTGCDAQPYFRIFNPWSQQKKFDKDALYIKKWIPELKDIPVKTIHKLFEAKNQLNKYSWPIVDHSTAAKKAKQMFVALK